MPDLPIEQSPEAELATLRKTVAELTQKNATRKVRLTELETNFATLTTKAAEAETRIKALTIDGPVNELCESISVAPQALRSAIESEYRIEMRDGALVLLNPSDSKPVMQNGKPVAFTADSIKSLLLASKDEAKLKLYNAILIFSKASGAGNESFSKRAVAPAPMSQFGLGIQHNQSK